jgi:tetratricopeptide (TPR) repeat protein
MKTWWLGLLFMLPWPAWAVLPNAAMPAEQTMQSMCQARTVANDQLGKRYCDGLRFINRAIKYPQDKTYYLNEALSNMDYVLSNTAKGDPVRADVHLAKAKALKMLGRKTEILAELMQVEQYGVHSIDLYRSLADVYAENGDKQKALETVIDGLRYNPKSKGLKLRYQDLGGKLPYP